MNRQLGEPVEIPWWGLALCGPPLLICVLAAVLPAPLWARAIALASSVALTWAVLRIATRAISNNLQSVWISTAYGVWAIFPLAWIAAVLAGSG